MPKRGGKKLVLGAFAATALLAFVALPALRPRCAEVHGDAVLTISLARLVRGEAVRFCFRDDAGERLRFLLARGSDGRVRSVFDACRQCFKFHQGYEVAGGMLICRLCGNRYAIDHMTEGEASCVPVSLPLSERGNTAQIKVSDLKRGRALF
ncbi:MAG TPA: Fe-S-containing protein [Candidatus Binataceae bacterium]|nr:Fe-S-containing protein [Candidatus Binataceae bacterium]